MEQKSYFQVKPTHKLDRCQFNDLAFSLEDIAYVDKVEVLASTMYCFRAYLRANNVVGMNYYTFTFTTKRDALTARNEFIKYWTGDKFNVNG